MIAIRQKNPRAFTLIEVMVVLAIIGIMTVLVVTSLGNGRVQRELETNAREFAAVVREAQNYALTGKQFVAGTTPCFFSVSGGGAGYTLTYGYKNVGTGACSETSPVNYALKNGVTFSGAVDTVPFTLPHATLDIVAGSKSATFIKSSTYHKVCVYADGRITDYAGNAVCP